MKDARARLCIFLAAIVLILSSCSKEKQLSSHDGFQKRKYLNGHYEIPKSTLPERSALETELRQKNPKLATTSSIDKEVEPFEQTNSLSNSLTAETQTRGDTKSKTIPERKSLKQELRSLIKEVKAKKETSAKDSRKSKTRSPNDGTTVNVVGLIGFVAGIIGLILAATGSWIGLLFIIAALVLGIVGLGAFKKEPGKYTGRGFALTAVIIGALSLFLLLLTVLLLANGLND